MSCLQIGRDELGEAKEEKTEINQKNELKRLGAALVSEEDNRRNPPDQQKLPKHTPIT